MEETIKQDIVDMDIIEESENVIQKSFTAQYAIGRKPILQQLSVIAREVMSGDWGYGTVRDKKLIESGYDLNAVYAKVDEMFGTNSGPFENYDVIITSSTLNVRKGPGYDHYIVTTLIDDKTIYTIVEEDVDSNGNKWGMLRSGLGWIMLDFTKKVSG